MMQFFIIPDGMPPYNQFSIEVTRERFDELCRQLFETAGVHISTDIETMYDTVIEKWFVSYLDYGQESIASCFGYTRAPIGDSDLYEQ